PPFRRSASARSRTSGTPHSSSPPTRPPTSRARRSSSTAARCCRSPWPRSRKWGRHDNHEAHYSTFPLPLREGARGRGLRAAARRESATAPTASRAFRFSCACRRQTPPPAPSHKGRGNVIALDAGQRHVRLRFLRLRRQGRLPRSLEGVL